MYCSTCGKPLERDAAFCSGCGSVVVKDNSNNFNSSTKQAEYGYQNNYNSSSHPKAKNKLVAGLLAIFLGSLGIHNFYLGYNTKGVAQLLLFVFWLGWVSFIWSIVEAVMIFLDKINTDAKGVPLSDSM